MSEPLINADFERELTLDELLKGVDKTRLSAALTVLLGSPVGIINDSGVCLLGENAAEMTEKVPLSGELETIGYLLGENGIAAERMRAAATMLQLILRCNARFLMASDLHLQTQRDDYQELQRRNAALQVSEARYKKLAETLEIRVKEQVEIIEKAHLKLYRNEKQASVGRLAAGVAHEVNNPLGFIRSNVATAVSYLEPFYEINALIHTGVPSSVLQKVWVERDIPAMLTDFKDLMNESVEGLDRIAKIVAALRGFSRIDHTEAEQTDLDTIVRQVYRMAESQLQHKAKLLLDLQAPLPVHCQAAQLGQVVYALLCNALDAIESTGVIRIRTFIRDNEIVLEVQDNGCGISEDDLLHVFEPFFTTKPVGQGTGLGLTVCNDIVKEHGGKIDVASQLGKGTRVRVVLPVRNEQPDQQGS
ncbi:MAG: hypothetical protein Kow0065_00780 [Methylomicrobium sp.]